MEVPTIRVYVCLLVALVPLIKIKVEVTLDETSLDSQYFLLSIYILSIPKYILCVTFVFLNYLVTI